MIKACLFDLDGTLIYTLESIRYFANKTISKRNIRKIDERETKIFVGRGVRRLFETILESRGFPLDKQETRDMLEQMLDEYNADYDADPLYLTKPYDEICDTVDSLFKSGITLAVISNKPDYPTRKIIEHFFPGKFAIVEGGSDRMPLKPNPEWPTDICKRLGALPSEVIYVGDTSTDMKTAKNFGAAVAVGVSWGFRDVPELIENGADRIISHPSELLGIIADANK